MSLTNDEILEQILLRRGLNDEELRRDFLNPSYEKHLHDPTLLPDVDKAVQRIAKSHELKEKVVIYGDYDIDGLTASTILSEALDRFGIDNEVYIPDRFEEGYGLNVQALDAIKEMGAKLVVTVDCGSVSFEPIEHAKEIGLDVIVTDHHNPGDRLPNAVAVINPKRSDSAYPFRDLAGVGVAFKLVCALQQVLEGLPDGQEKWLLDLVALGTVCDVVDLVDENRAIVYWGLKVARQTRRPGLRSLAQVSSSSLLEIDTTTFGFRFGPRLNASGRLENARKSLKLLQAGDSDVADELAQNLDLLNYERRSLQNRIFTEAKEIAQHSEDSVLVLSGEGWSQGVVGIVAAKLLEKYKKPTFVFEDLGETMKGSARSFGDYLAVDAVRAAKDILISGGGHAAAAGCTIKSSDFEKFRFIVNEHYRKLGLKNQQELLEPKEDVVLDDFQAVSLDLYATLTALEPFGNANPMPIFRLNSAELVEVRHMGQSGDHIRARLVDRVGGSFECIGFNMREDFDNLSENTVDLWFYVEKNVFRGNAKVQARLIKVAKSHLLG